MGSAVADRFRIVRAQEHGHVSDEIVRAIESETSAATKWKIEPALPGALQKVARVCASYSFPFPIKKGRDLFMVMMGTHRIPLNAADWLATRGSRVAWAFDVWPESYDAMRSYLERYDIDTLFVTAKQSADRIARAVPERQVHWCAEPFVDLGFSPKPWAHRKTDLVQFGRRYEPYHQRLLNDLSESQMRYLYEETPGKVVWPTKTEFVLGLCDARVSVCFPSDLTHPARAGDVSTVTQRYFQSFASGCVVVGTTPPELVTLFGYDPVVQADMDDPGAQVTEILSAPDKYMPLVERNLKEVRQHATAERVSAILRELE